MKIDLYPGEIIVDSFAGGGGASLGIELALGRSPDIAINHDPEAIAMHQANHPHTRHYCESVWDVSPRKACAGRPVGLAWFSPDCFPAGTLVLTRQGYRPIEEINVGDEVLTHMQRWRKVTETSTSHRPLLKIKGHGHPGLLVSPEHPFYARHRQNIWNNGRRSYDRVLDPADWAPASMLDKGWYWASPTVFPESEVPCVAGRGMEIDVKLMWLAGRYLGDGWTRLTDTRAELVITCGMHDIESLRERLKVWERSGNRCGFNELAWHERETSTAYQFSTNHQGLVKWLRQYFGHRAEAKGIPAWALGMSSELKQALIDGYLSADGWDQGSFGEAVTVSKSLAFGMKALLNSMGKTVAVYKKQNNNLIQDRVVNVRDSYSLRWRYSTDEKHIQTFLEDGLEWCPVRSQTHECEEADVFNIGVDEDESYVVEGIIVHNCKHFSKAKGGKPVDKAIRGLAWVVIRWARDVRPRMIFMENVEEFKTWGGLLPSGKPCPIQKGRTFQRWVKELRSLGYQVEYRELRACDYGAPTTRKRLFVIARCDGKRIVWPEPTHGPGRAHPYRTAAECIDWSIPCPSIFDRARPLAENTLRRIARGLKRYVIDAADPYIVRIGHTGHGDSGKVRGISEPLSTITSKAEHCLIKPQLVSAFLAKHYQGVVGSALQKPIDTITSIDHHSLVAAYIKRDFGNSVGSDLNSPLPTITSNGGGKAALVYAFMIKYFGTDQNPVLDESLHTITTKDRFGLVTVNGDAHQVVGVGCTTGETRLVIDDLGMRMLAPRELFTAQGFPSSYRIEVEYKGKILSKTAQVRMCGNSVSPPMGAALVLANVGATAAMGPAPGQWQPGMVKSGEQLPLFDLEAIA